VTISVVVTTFEWPAALRRVLEALLRQTDRDFEILVADDGSGAKTAEVVEHVAESSPVPVTHVWQPHRGFRAGAARNAAAGKAAGDYLVFLDGDSIPGPRFVAAHRAARRPGWAVRGRRTLLSPELSRRTLGGDIDPSRAGPARWIAWRLTGGLSRLRPVLCFDLAPPITATGIAWRRVHTVNFAVGRRDFERVNGFDESFVGWGLEDSDLVVRLANARVRTRGLGAAGSVFHLHHGTPARDADALAARRRLVESRIGTGHERCEPGLDRLDREASSRRFASRPVSRADSQKPEPADTVRPHAAA
jgi:glycosyltransferase involved in cell wall biosynthesis